MKKSPSLMVLLVTLVVFAFSPAVSAVHGQTSSAPSISLLPPAAPPGTPITVKGANFEPGATVDLSWFGYIVDVPGIAGHLDYYPIKTGITVSSDGSFTATIIVPYDFTDVLHFVNATQNGVGTGIMNTTFTIVPRLHLSPQPANYTEGQEILLHVYGGPFGTPAVMMGVSPFPEVMILKFTYDNVFWGFATSHLETEGPIVTGGFGVGGVGDVGGNITMRFKAVGGVGKHNIRAYIGGKDTPPYLPCEIGDEVDFYIIGPSIDTQSVLDRLAALEAKTTSLQSAVSSVQNTVSGVKGAADSGVNYGLGALAISAVNLIILLVIAYRAFRKTY